MYRIHWKCPWSPSDFRARLAVLETLHRQVKMTRAVSPAGTSHERISSCPLPFSLHRAVTQADRAPHLSEVLNTATGWYCHFAGDLLNRQPQLPGEEHLSLAGVGCRLLLAAWYQQMELKDPTHKEMVKLMSRVHAGILPFSGAAGICPLPCPPSEPALRS